MAEVAGIALGVAGLAGLFSAVIEVWDFVDAGRGYAQEYSYLRTRLDNQREVFVQWGRRMNFGTATGYNSRLDEPGIRLRIEASLQHIQLLFSNTDELVKRYGIKIEEKEVDGVVQPPRFIQIWKPSFDRFRDTLQRNQKKGSPFKVTRWSIRDAEKFKNMVECVSELLRDLNEMTRDFVSQQRQEAIAREEAETIEDIQQLKQVQQAIPEQAGYAETLLSSAASVRQQQLERGDTQTVSTDLSKTRISNIEAGSLNSTSYEASFHTANTSSPPNFIAIAGQCQSVPWLVLSNQQKGRAYLRSINLSDDGRNLSDDGDLLFVPGRVHNELRYYFRLDVVIISNIPQICEGQLLLAMATAGLPVPSSLSIGREEETGKDVATAICSSVKDAARIILDMDHSILYPYLEELNVKYSEGSDIRERTTQMIEEEKTYATHRLAALIEVNLLALKASLHVEQTTDTVNSTARNRMFQEIGEVIRSKGSSGITESVHDSFVTWAPLTPENHFELLGSIRGPLNSPYEGGIFHVRIKVPNKYPFIPPKCWFVTKIYHPNIDEKGAICVDLLDEDNNKWSPVMTISKVLFCILALLGAPNFEDPVNLGVGSLGWADMDGYILRAKDWTSRYATGEIGEVREARMAGKKEG